MIAVVDNIEFCRKNMNNLAVIILALYLSGFGIQLVADINQKNGFNYWSNFWGETDVLKIYHRSDEFTWYKLDDFSNLPDDLTIATSEVSISNESSEKSN